MPADPVLVVLVGGHESAQGADLVRLEKVVDGAVACAPGRGLHNLVSAALDARGTIVVVPMTFGRNPTMVADTAKTLKWLASAHAGRVALAAPFGQPDHLTAWLRTAANAAKRTDPDTALLIVASPSNPFDEADLHRTAYLVATHGALTEVGVAIADEADGIAAGVDRLRRLGAERIVTVPAGFAAQLDASVAEFSGPLMSDASIARVIRTRVHDALAALDSGYDGIDDGLTADHGHGYAHSHAFEESQGGGGHAAAHSHSHGHGHSHAHPRGHGHDHAHDDDHDHDHDAPRAHEHHH